jgi:hypothetical protein
VTPLFLAVAGTASAPAPGLDKEIVDYAGVVSLLLVLLTLFTLQRAGALDVLRRSDDPTMRQATIGVSLDVLLSLAYFLLAFSAAPLALEAARHVSVFDANHAVRPAFVLVFLLVVALGLWQVALIRSSWKTRREL